MNAYTYSITHLPSGLVYYGVRKSKQFDLGITYFSSSKLVKKLISNEELCNFEFRLRRKFESYEEARNHETKFLQKINAESNPKVLNQAISAPRVPVKGSLSDIKRREKISNTMKLKWKNDVDYKNRSNFNKVSKEECIRRGKLGAQKKALIREKSQNINEPPKPVKPRNRGTSLKYKEIKITKDGIIKTIRQNQTTVYLRMGWVKL